MLIAVATLNWSHHAQMAFIYAMRLCRCHASPTPDDSRREDL